MTSITEGTATPGEVTVDGKEYSVGRMSWKDMGRYEDWMRQQIIKVARNEAVEMQLEIDDLRTMLKSADPKSDETRDTRRRYVTMKTILSEILPAAYKSIEQITIFSPSAQNGLMVSVAGAIKLVWISMRKEDSSMTEEMAYGIFKEQEDIQNAMEEVRRINPQIFGKEEEKKTPDPDADPADEDSDDESQDGGDSEDAVDKSEPDSPVPVPVHSGGTG